MEQESQLRYWGFYIELSINKLLALLACSNGTKKKNLIEVRLIKIYNLQVPIKKYIFMVKFE
jgi:hypothetical protein